MQKLCQRYWRISIKQRWKKVIKIGTCGSADTFRAVQKVLDAYNLPNEALNNGEIDLNSFQHKAYLENECKKQGHDLTTIGDTSSAPFTLYSKNVDSLKALKTLFFRSCCVIVLAPCDISPDESVIEAARKIPLISIPLCS